MKLTSILATLVAAFALAGVATASPQGRGHGHIRVSVDHRASSFVGAAAAYIGIDKTAVRADLKAGKSLGTIATEHGKTVDGLVAALIAPAKLKLDAAVAAGRLTAAREATLLTRLQTAVTRLVNATPKSHARTKHVRVPVAAILKPALAYLGLDMRALVTQLRSGKTLTDIAVAQNKTAVGLVDAIVASVKAKLDARVAAGKLSAADEATFLTTLQTNVTTLVTGS